MFKPATILHLFFALCFFSAVALGVPDAQAADKINLNTATVEQLMNLPGIGPSLAERIIEHRTITPFKSVEDLLEVKGIGNSKFEKLRDLVTI
jgi:competence ComEA-like helix-hairpin-helix protein